MIEPVGRPLLVMATVRRAYEILWQNRALLMRLLLLPLILLTAAIALESRIFGDAMTPMEMRAAVAAAPHSMMLSWAATMSLGVATMLSFSVSWRRHLLLQEQPSAHYFANPFWRYLGFGVAIYLGALLYFLVTFALVGGVLTVVGLKGEPTLFIAIAALCIILISGAFIFWLVRHILLFTGVCVDNRDLAWKQASALMRGNVWRFIGIWSLMWLPISFGSDIIAIVLASLGLDLGTIAGALTIGFLQAVAILLQVVIGSSAGALIYDYLVRGGGPARSTYSIQA